MMMFRLAVRSLLTHPGRSAVLAGGFGLGVSVMANLLSIGEVMLEQARSPALAGGGGPRHRRGFRRSEERAVRPVWRLAGTPT